MNERVSASIIAFGEFGFLIYPTARADKVAMAMACNGLAARLVATRRFANVTPGLDSVGVQFDPQDIDADQALQLLTAHMAQPAAASPDAAGKITLPVCYNANHAPDLTDVMAHTGLTHAALIERHTAHPVRVLNMGFAPGFAYLGPIADGLMVPRRSTPRTQVAAGSIGLAAGFTGIYSLPTPGGWHLIGRTPIKLFDPAREQPFALQPNVEVQFCAISASEFDKLARQRGGVHAS